MTVALAFENVCKSYRGGREYAALRDDLMRGVGRLVGLHRGDRAVVNALDDVSFTINEGESVAIIGDNGAGKTTALKLATRITYPTRGTIRVRGRVGALIEVGTGMHPELTGRENVHLYGQILGLSRLDTQRRFDEIVEFAGIGAAIDQPVKQYSSGMQLRLGFSVAAHLEPDVLIVDEAIAVGDAGFQYRCVERMSEIVRDGRTLVFVSHDMKAIELLCDRAIRLEAGALVDDRDARSVIVDYLGGVARRGTTRSEAMYLSSDEMRINEVAVQGQVDPGVVVTSGESLTIRLSFTAHRRIEEPLFCFALSEGGRRGFAQAAGAVDGWVPAAIEGEGSVECVFTSLPLRPRVYEIWGGVAGRSGGLLLDWQRLGWFEVRDLEYAGQLDATALMTEAPVRIPHEWRLTLGDAPARGCKGGLE